MNLDDFKQDWQQRPTTTHISAQDVQEMLRADVTDVVVKLRRSVRWELYSTLAMLIVCIVATPFLDSIEYRVGGCVLAITCALYCVYYYKKLLLVNSISPFTQDLKTETVSLLTRFKRYLRFYRAGYRVLIPISMLIGMTIGGRLIEGENYLKVFMNPIAVVLILFVLISVAYLFDLALKWYLHKLYGVWLKHLEKIVKEFDET